MRSNALVCWRFLAKKTSISTEPDCKQDLLALTILWAELKALSVGTDAAGIHKYFLANLG